MAMRRWAGRAVPLAALALAAALGWSLLGPDGIAARLGEAREALIALRDANYALAALLFVCGYAAMVALSLPGATAASLTGGFVFGALAGTALNVLAATIGAVILFCAVRAGLGGWAEARIDAAGPAARRLRRRLLEAEVSVLLAMRLAPVVPFFVANLLPALVGVRLAPFALTTLVGIIPGAAVYSSIGAGLGDALAAGEGAGALLGWKVIAPLSALAALALIPALVKLARRAPEADAETGS